MGGFIQYKHGCVRSVAAGRCAKEAQRDLVPGSAFPTPTLQLLRDIYLPSNQVLELLDLFVGLRVLLQVPLGEEGLVGRESLMRAGSRDLLLTEYGRSDGLPLPLL